MRHDRSHRFRHSLGKGNGPTGIGINGSGFNGASGHHITVLNGLVTGMYTGISLLFNSRVIGVTVTFNDRAIIAADSLATGARRQSQSSLSWSLYVWAR